MGNRLSKIYTRTGDDGSTGLGDGSRIAKENLRVEAYGTVDETNSAVGVILGNPALPADIQRVLTEIQHDLFDLGGELCIPGHVMISAAHVDRLERELDGFNEGLPRSRSSFCPAAARPRLHVILPAPSAAAPSGAAGRWRASRTYRAMHSNI